ncbi:MAG: YciI family protein [Acidimicrobiia bacterium]|nr:MAG: YciI family protein [Acidimicrobiia bacterium]
MPKYMMVYKGEATDLTDMSEEEAGAVMAKWDVWIEGIGSALSDIGTPFGPASSIVDDGTAGTAHSLSGYSIVEANDMDAAQGLADGHPFLSEGKGDYAIDIYELMPLPVGD